MCRRIKIGCEKVSKQNTFLKNNATYMFEQFNEIGVSGTLFGYQATEIYFKISHLVGFLLLRSIKGCSAHQTSCLYKKS